MLILKTYEKSHEISISFQKRSSAIKGSVMIISIPYYCNTASTYDGLDANIPKSRHLNTSL